jgi:hypothetical protein
MPIKPQEETWMPKQLSSSAIDAYQRDGYYFPVSALTSAEVALPGLPREA